MCFLHLDFQAVPDGSLILVVDDEGEAVHGIDPRTCEVALKLTHRKDSYFPLGEFKFAMDNTLAVCTMELKVSKEDITTLTVFNLREQKLQHFCFDKQSYLRNMIKKKKGLVKNDDEIDMNVFCFQVVADKTAVCGSMDAVIRVWDLTTGEFWELAS